MYPDTQGQFYSGSIGPLLTHYVLSGLSYFFFTGLQRCTIRCLKRVQWAELFQNNVYVNFTVNEFELHGLDFLGLNILVFILNDLLNRRPRKPRTGTLSPRINLENGKKIEQPTNQTSKSNQEEEENQDQPQQRRASTKP